MQEPLQGIDTGAQKVRWKDAGDDVDRIGHFWTQDARVRAEVLTTQRRDFVDVRNKYMLLASAMTGGVLPLLSATALDLNKWHIKGAGMCLLATVIYGAISHVLHRIPYVRTMTMVHRLNEANMMLALAVCLRRDHGITEIPDVKLADDGAQRVQQLTGDLEKYAGRNLWLFAADDMLFFGLFVAGVANLLLAFT